MTYPWEKHAFDQYAGFHPSMRDDEFIEWLRYYFIKKNAPPRLVDKLDEIESQVAEGLIEDAYNEGFKDGEESAKNELSVGNGSRETT